MKCIPCDEKTVNPPGKVGAMTVLHCFNYPCNPKDAEGCWGLRGGGGGGGGGGDIAINRDRK